MSFQAAAAAAAGPSASHRQHHNHYGSPPLHRSTYHPQPHPHPHPQQRAQPQTPAQTHPAFDAPPPSQPPSHRADDPQFDIFEWHPKYVSCQRYFLDHAQHSAPVQAVAAFLNIHLPCQRTPPVNSSQSSRLPSVFATHGPHNPHGGVSLPAGAPPAPPPSSVFPGPPPATSLTPYLRRLVVTGLDFPGVLHGFFGDDWAPGIGPMHEQERRNLLFAAKSGGWAGVKKDYDMPPLETVPFLRPLQGVVEEEVLAAERSWSEWLAMEDWMVGPRAPADPADSSRGPAQGANHHGAR